MKKLIVVLLLVATMFTMTACGSKTPVQLLFRQNWLIDAENKTEILTYSVSTVDVDEKGNETPVGTQSGSYVVSYTKTNSTTVAGETFDVPGYRVETELTFGDDVLRTVAYFSPAGLNGEVYYPIASSRNGCVDGKYYSEFIRYGKSFAEYRSSESETLPDSAEMQKTKLSAPYYDNNQLYTILRAAPIDSAFTFNFQTVIPSEGGGVGLACAYSASEKIALTLNGTAESRSAAKLYVMRNQRITGRSNYVWIADSAIKVGEYTYRQVPLKIREDKTVFLLTNIETK